MNMPRPARILLVEDNSGDEFLVRDAFERGRARHQLEVVRDGEAALDRLRGWANILKNRHRISSCWTSTCPRLTDVMS